ncbi:helix-turn-helix transcriptional regulator [Adlercreutzia aquisgranensis]|uniref:helix-turn-helix transcriptional regulator n=1 Tax=Adlercreutzia aquisgranensis TaxID=2941323 RepID=UPI00204013AF|nr:LuxR C-terminal-related transcriptional regulator [Adlercreutzia aquisgranensis]
MGKRKKREAGRALVLHPAFFGFGLLLAWKAFVVPFAAPKVFSSSLQILVPVVAVLLWKHLHPLERRPGVLWGIGGAGTAAALLLGFASAGQPFAALPFVFELASYASSAVYTLFFLLWCELYAKLDIASAGVAVAGSYLLGSALYFGLGPLDASMLLGIGMALPLASSAMLSCGLGYLVRAAGSGAPNRWRGESLASLLHSRIFPWRIIFVIGVFYFAAGVSRAVLSTSLDLLSVGCAGGLVVALVALSSMRSSGVSIYRMMGIALPVMAVSLLVGVIAGDGDAAARVLISVAQTVGMIVLVMLLCDSSHRFGLPVVVLVAAARIVTTVAFLAGGYTSGMTLELANRTLGTELLYAVAIVAFGVATAYWLYGVNAANEFAVQEGDAPSSARSPLRGAVGFGDCEAKGSARAEGVQEGQLPRALTGDQASEALRTYIELRSHALAESYGLSPRETDVLVLLAWGKSIHAVEETLVLSTNTIKTHVRHIYSKLGIHSRAELDMLLYDDSLVGTGCSGE